MKKYYGLIILVVLLLAGSWMLFVMESTVRSKEVLQSDTEYLFIICTMVKSDVSSARIAENTIMLSKSFESMSPVVIEKKEEFIIKALESAEDSAELYNHLTSKYTEEQLAKLNLPYKLETNIDTNTVIKCTNNK